MDKAILFGTKGRGGPSLSLSNVDIAYMYNTHIFDSHNTGFIKEGSSYITLEKGK
jgi:hypothetical protein